MARLTREKRTRARELLAEAPPLDPAATALIASLSADQRLGLASSASRASVELYLDASALRERFHVVLSGEDVARAKPDPEIYLSACEALGVAPSEAVIFEDSLSGVAAGVGAGSRVIGVASSRPKEELLAAGAVAAVSDLWEAAAL